MRRATIVRLVGLSVVAVAIVVGPVTRPLAEAAPVPKVRDKLAAPMQELTALLPTRENPIQPGTEAEWAVAEKEMQIKFPKEYKRFVQTYGWVVVNKFLIFHSPTDSSEVINLRERMDFYRKYADDSEVVWPTEGGILPIASSVCADHLCYRCKGEPNEWTVVIVTREGKVQCEYPFGLIEFMTRMADGTLDLGKMGVHKEMHPPLSFK